MTSPITPKTVLVTGASDGIGAASVRRLAADGHRVLITGRSPEKTTTVAKETGARAFIADFAKLDDVRRLADDVLRELDGGGLDVLANNAGGIFGTREPTVDGYEKTLQVNHLAPFLLTHLLMAPLLAARGAVVNTSSVANRVFGHLDLDDLDNARKYSSQKAYGDAKLANILFTRELHRRFHSEGLTSVAFHPGNVATSFASDTTSPMRFVYTTPLRRLFLISAEKGSANLTWFVEGTPDVTWESGTYYDERSPEGKVNPQVYDDALAAGLWEKSARLVGIA